MNANLYTLFERGMRRDPGKLAIGVDRQSGMSFGDLEAWSARLATQLVTAGLEPGDRVLVQVAKSPMAIGLHLACLRAGLIYIPLNTAYTAKEIRYFVQDSGAAMLVCDPSSKVALRETASASVLGCLIETMDARGAGTLVDAASDHASSFATVSTGPTTPAAVLYTSGTTGKPKGAILTHGNLRSNVESLSEAWAFKTSDVILHPLPIFHAHGLFVASHLALLQGATTHFVVKFDIERVIDLLPQCTVMMAVPTIYARLADDPRLNREVCRTMRLFVSGSAALSESILSKFELATGHRILERYGATETLICTANPLVGDRKAGTVGVPLSSVDVRLVDDDGEPVRVDGVGHVQVRGPNVFAGYWGRSNADHEVFTEDGYFRQGDLGRVDAQGYLSIVGRSKDLIISGGFNVYPMEIEAALEEIDGVAEAAVFGAPHPDFGEAVIAAVVARDGLGNEDITEALRGSLASFKVPKHLVRCKSLPRNAMGKVSKVDLRAAYADVFAARQAG